jgi:UMF1 family MFS transporter
MAQDTAVPAHGSQTSVVPASISKRAVASWALYDLGNTLFSLNIVSLYFPLWVTIDMGGRDGDYGLAASLSMALMFISAPLLGALSDQAPRRMPFLVVSTLVCCALTALLGTGGLFVSLALFVAANYFYQAGLIFYDALLPSVSTEENRGKIGGLGVGVGYLGSIIGIAVGGLVLRADPAAKPLVFQLTALLFLLFAIPCFLWVRERRRTDVAPFGGEAVRRAVAELRDTLVRARQYPGLARFLAGRIFYADAANTIIAFMGIYATKEIGFAEEQVQFLLLAGIVAAVVGGLVWGMVVDRIGPKRTLDGVLGLWAVVFSLAAAIAYLHLPNTLFWLVAPLAGIALGGTWAADRPFMLRLTPPRRLGQFYGLYAMVGRFAAILGPLLWTAIVDWLGWGRPVAVISLLVMVAIAFVVLRPVSDARRAWSADERLPNA